MKTKRFSIILIITLIAISAVFLAVFEHYHPRHYSNLNVATTTNEAFSTQISQNRQRQLNYVFVYKPGCDDCNHVESSVLPKLSHLQQQHRLLLINANNKRTLSYLHANAVTNTPTVLVKYHDYTIYSYSGRNINKFLTILNGQNPKTKRNFKLKMPTSTHIQNDFTHTNETEPVQRINSPNIQTTFNN